MTTTDSPVWPLLFTHRGSIIGKGFVAEVAIFGRLIARVEAEGVWFDGVNPGAMAVGAKTLSEGGPEVRDVITSVLVDFAEEADTFDDFKARVEAFVNETDDGTVAEWKDAVQQVRDGHVTIPDLPMHSADQAVSVKVIQKPLSALTSADNLAVVDEGLAAAA